MALLTKNKINQFGVKEEYWRVLTINLNLQYGYCDITLGGYMDEQTRIKGLEPMNIRKVRAKWSDDEFATYFTTSRMNQQGTNIYSQVYKYIKYKDEYFSDAIDV